MIRREDPRQSRPNSPDADAEVQPAEEQPTPLEGLDNGRGTATTTVTCERFWSQLTEPWDATEEVAPPLLELARERLGSQSDSEDALPPGYLLKGILGGGGFGVVLDAVHQETDKRVAFKILRRSRSPRDVDLFRREAKIAGSLVHPRLLYTFDYIEMGPHLGIVSEHLAGGTLQDRLQSEEPVSTTDAIRWTVQILEGLQVLHEQGLMHRDIKPANCFLTERGDVKLGDFGLAGRSPTLGVKEPAVVGGTPGYSAPEQMAGAPPDERADVFAVGATLFTLLAREPRPDDISTGKVTRALRAKRPDVTRRIARVVECAMRTDPRQRPASASHLRQLLLAYSSWSPAPLGPRVYAGIVDCMLVGFLMGPARSIARQDPSVALVLGPLVIFLGLCYFGVGEGVFGRMYGKKLLRLRVIGSQGEPSFLRAWLRTLLFMVAPLSAAIAVSLGIGSLSSFGLLLLGAYVICFLPTLFASTNHRGLHEILSGTRTIREAALPPPPPYLTREEPKGAPAHSYLPKQIASARIVDWVSRTTNGKLYLARDPQFQRTVWLHLRDSEEVAPDDDLESPPDPIRLLATRAVADSWEDPGGASLVSCLRAAQHIRWAQLRDWTRFLCDAAEKGTRIRCTSQLWLDRDVKLRLLPFVRHFEEDSSADSAPKALTRDWIPQIARALRRAAIAKGLGIPDRGLQILDGLADAPVSAEVATRLRSRLLSIAPRPHPLSQRRIAARYLTAWGLLLAEGALSTPVTGLLPSTGGLLIPLTTTALLFVVAFGASAVAFRGGWTMRLFGVAIRELRTGARPSSSHLALRSGLVALVPVSLWGAFCLTAKSGQSGPIAVLTILILVAGLAFTSARQGRSLDGRLVMLRR